MPESLAALRWARPRPQPEYSLNVLLHTRNLQVGLEHVTILLPSKVHVVFGVGLHKLGYEVGGHAEARIQIESMHPVRRIRRRRAVALRQQALRQRMPP